MCVLFHVYFPQLGRVFRKGSRREGHTLGRHYIRIFIYIHIHFALSLLHTLLLYTAFSSNLFSVSWFMSEWDGNL